MMKLQTFREWLADREAGQRAAQQVSGQVSENDIDKLTRQIVWHCRTVNDAIDFVERVVSGRSPASNDEPLFKMLRQQFGNNLAPTLLLVARKLVTMRKLQGGMGYAA